METPKLDLISVHPLMIKYQAELNEKLLKSLLEADEQLNDLNKTIRDQEKENDNFSKQEYDLQQELKQQEEKLAKIYNKYENQIEIKQAMLQKCQNITQEFEEVQEIWKAGIKFDLEYQKKLEDVSIQVVQLTSLRDETFTDTKSLQRAVEKTAQDRGNLELQKLRKDLLISHLENDNYSLEDKINLYKAQCAIKKEEVADLRKELNAAHIEMEIINFEKQQIGHQWKKSLASLEKHDCVLSEIKRSPRVFENDMQTLNMEIATHKKSIRKELERNEMLTMQSQLKECDIARSEKELQDTTEKEKSFQENISVLKQIIEITENELKFFNNSHILKEKGLEAKERDIQKCCSLFKSLEEDHMYVLDRKITITKASKHTEKIIKDIRNSISISENNRLIKEGEKEKLLLQVDNLRMSLSNLEDNLKGLQKESKERGLLLEKSEDNVVKTRVKMDLRRNEYKTLEKELQELIIRVGGQQLAPVERKLANLRKEINLAEQEKGVMEHEYLHYQHQLFTLSNQRSSRNVENDMYKKKIVIMEKNKLQLEADICKEGKDIKDTHYRIHKVENNLFLINKLLNERKELQEFLRQTTDLSKLDFNLTLKEAELNNLQKLAEVNCIRRKKHKLISRVAELQKYTIFWKQKVYLAEETRRILKSNAYCNALFQIRSEIHRIELKQEQIKKAHEKLVQDMEREVSRHVHLYVEADKQALYGRRRKTPEYVKKRILYNGKKIVQDKKAVENCSKQIESLKIAESQLEEVVASKNSFASTMMNEISAIEHNTDNKLREKRQAVIKLSFKQKKIKLLEKFKDGTYIQAVRNGEKRPEEIVRIQNGLCAVQAILQAAMNEHPYLTKDLSKVMDYVIISKQI